MAKKRQDDGTEIETDEVEQAPPPTDNKAPKEAAMARSLPDADAVCLVAMRKGREMIDVHPTTVADHEKAGWEVA
jgi:hypothetical protein